MLEEILPLIDDLPTEGGERLFEPCKKVPVDRSALDQPPTPTEKFRNLLIRLGENWPTYRIFDWQCEVSCTNNDTERVIGRIDVRSRPVRGDKFKNGLRNGLILAGS